MQNQRVSLDSAPRKNELNSLLGTVILLFCFTPRLEINAAVPVEWLPNSMCGEGEKVAEYAKKNILERTDPTLVSPEISPGTVLYLDSCTKQGVGVVVLRAPFRTE